MKTSFCKSSGLLLMLVLFAGSLDRLHAQGSGATWVPGPVMNKSRIFTYTSTMNNGKVLLMGGRSFNFVSCGFADVYDPSANTFTEVTLNTPRDYAAVVKMDDGRYYVAGGAHDLGVAPGYSEAEIYDPVSNTSTAVANMSMSRCGLYGAQLTGGKILLASAWYNTAGATNGEVYDPATNSYAATGALNQPRSNCIILPCSDGGAVVAGGYATFGGPVYEMVEYFDSTTRNFSILTNTPVPSDSGWLIANTVFHQRPCADYKRTNGKYVVGAFRSNAGTEYALLEFDPATKAFTKINTSSPLRDSLTDGGFSDGVLDKTNDIFYMIGLDSASSPQAISVVAVDLISGHVYHPSASWTLPSTQFLMGSMGFIPSNGKILYTGISSSPSDYFHATDSTYLLTPDAITGISARQTEATSLRCYPNPSSGHFTLRGKAAFTGDMQIALTDVTGRTVWTSSREVQESTAFQWEFSGMTLSPGVYHLSVYGPGQHETLRMVFTGR